MASGKCCTSDMPDSLANPGCWDSQQRMAAARLLHPPPHPCRSKMSQCSVARPATPIFPLERPFNLQAISYPVASHCDPHGRPNSKNSPSVGVPCSRSELPHTTLVGCLDLCRPLGRPHGSEKNFGRVEGGRGGAIGRHENSLGGPLPTQSFWSFTLGPPSTPRIRAEGRLLSLSVNPRQAQKLPGCCNLWFSLSRFT